MDNEMVSVLSIMMVFGVVIAVAGLSYVQDRPNDNGEE